jgi:hypothetical protein
MRNAALFLICSLAAGRAAAQPETPPPAPRTTMPETATCSGHVTVGCSAAWTDSKTLNDGNGDRASPGDRAVPSDRAVPDRGRADAVGSGGGQAASAPVRTPAGR